MEEMDHLSMAFENREPHTTNGPDVKRGPAPDEKPR